MSSEELEQIYDAHAEALFRYLCTFVQDVAEAHDLLQDLFVKIARTPNCLEGVKQPKAFLFRLAHNLAIDAHRRRKRHRDKLTEFGKAPLPLFAPTEDPDLRAFRDQLAAALANLPISQREVLYLKLFESMSFAAIASLLDIPNDTAASRYRYGIQKLREHFRPLYDELNEDA